MDEEGTSITMYYDIKPLSNGRITFAIYRDSQCTDEVSDDVDVVQNAIGNPFTDAEASGSQDYSNYDFSGDTLEESLARWETAFSEWTFCHPCVAFDVENTDGTKYLQNDNDGGYGYNDDAARRLGGDYEAQGEIFECYDDAGYTNVNQVSFCELQPLFPSDSRALLLVVLLLYQVHEILRQNVYANRYFPRHVTGPFAKCHGGFSTLWILSSCRIPKPRLDKRNHVPHILGVNRVLCSCLCLCV